MTRNEQFAIAAGWQYEKAEWSGSCYEPAVWINPTMDQAALPDFENDLPACFEVLHHVLPNYDIKCRNGSWFSVTGYRPSEEYYGEGSPKLTEAIMNAVLKYAAVLALSVHTQDKT